MTSSNLLGYAAIVAGLIATGVSAAAENPVRIATMPTGAEVTGLSTNAAGELFLNAQHPGGDNVFSRANDATPALVGYVHGFNSSRFAGPSMPIPPENKHNTVNVASGTYVTFGKAGDRLGSGQVLGGVYDVTGNLMYISNTPDFNGFVPLSPNEAYLYTSWEGASRDGASAVSRILLKKVNNRWEADLSASQMMDLSAIEGALVLCSGIVTQWGSPLLAEEYFFYNTATWNHPDNHDADERASFQGGNDINFIKPKNMADYLGRLPNPYRYGYMIEVINPTSSGAEQLVKHFSTGRLSHETAAVMPDQRTVYMTDDDSAVYSHKKYNTASGGVLFKFIADAASDLSTGTLYAAKLHQDRTQDPHKAGFDVTWLELGHGNNTEIESWISEYDGIQVSDYVEGQTNYISDADIVAYAEGKSGRDLNGDGKLSRYKDARPAFLESRRVAAALGATNEWDKLEGVTMHGNNVYIAVSALSFTMDKDWGHKDWSNGKIDEANPGAIALENEQCGGTYVSVTDSDYNITRIDPYVIGRSNTDGMCDVNLPANPDNILAMNDGTLMIGEDAGSKRHPLDMLWMVK